MKTLFLIFILIILSSFLYSTIWHVPVDYSTIQAGIGRASNSDTVLVQPGTYVENINFDGKLITVGSLFLTTTEPSYISSTIIDGNLIGSVVTFDSGEDPIAVLSGFTITNGSSSGGGGIYCSNASPSLDNLIISGNSAQTGAGGGIYCWNNSSPILQNVSITNNSALYSHGGGIYLHNSSPSLNNVTISGNYAYDGGGIYCYQSSPSLDNVTISSNTVQYGGGGIFFIQSSPSLDNVTISENSAINDGGGGIYCLDNSNPILQNVTITGNSAQPGTGGGGIYCNSSNFNLTNSILWNDSPDEIYILSGSVAATYSDIQNGLWGIGNINSDPLFVDPLNNFYNLLYNSPCIDAGDPSSPLDPDGTRADIGAYFCDQSINGNPSITAVTDVPHDQGRYVQVIWDKSPFDIPGASVPLESYSVWRYDDLFDDRGKLEIYENPREILERAVLGYDKNYYWQRNDEILTFITQLPVMGYDQYSIISPTLQDSSTVSTNYSTFHVVAHTDDAYLYFTSLPDSGYSVDNIAPDETEVTITQNGSNIGLSWDEVEYGTYQGNSYPEINGIWYKIYAGDSPDFVCDEAHLIDTVTDLYYDYPLAGEEKKFFKIVVSDQPSSDRFINRFDKLEEPNGDYQKVRR